MVRVPTHNSKLMTQNSKGSAQPNVSAFRDFKGGALG